MADAPFSPGRGEDREPGPPAKKPPGWLLDIQDYLLCAWEETLAHPHRFLLLLLPMLVPLEGYAPHGLGRLLKALTLALDILLMLLVAIGQA